MSHCAEMNTIRTCIALDVLGLGFVIAGLIVRNPKAQWALIGACWGCLILSWTKPYAGWFARRELAEDLEILDRDTE